MMVTVSVSFKRKNPLASVASMTFDTFGREMEFENSNPFPDEVELCSMIVSLCEDFAREKNKIQKK